MAVDPDVKALDRFLAEDHGGEVVMMNLLRFDPVGKADYRTYSRVVGEQILPRYGAELIYYGLGSTPLIAETGEAWDAVMLVRYPSRDAFARMVADPEFREVAQLRTRALTATVLQATVPLSPEAR